MTEATGSASTCRRDGLLREIGALAAEALLVAVSLVPAAARPFDRTADSDEG